MRRLMSILGGALLAGMAAAPCALADWQSAGIPVCTNPANQYLPALLAGPDGVFVLWGDLRSDYSTYGDRLDADGSLNANWPADGKFVALGDQGSKSLVSDGAGGLYMTYLTLGTRYDVYAQHIDSFGNPFPGWPAAGLGLAAGPDIEDDPGAAPDDSGGVFTIWEDGTLHQIRGLRLRADGSPAPGWPATGKLLSTSGRLAGGPSIISDGEGKSKPEIMRILKRYVARETFRHLPRT